MQSSATDPVEEPPVSQIPEDVAAVYRWANLPDVTYRDFSASRRKLRAQRDHPIEPPPPSQDPAMTSPDRAFLEPLLPAVSREVHPEIQIQSVHPPQAIHSEEPRRITLQQPVVPAKVIPFVLEDPQIQYFSMLDATTNAATEEAIAPAPGWLTQALEPKIPHHATFASPIRAQEPFRARWLTLAAPMPGTCHLPPIPSPGMTPILAVFAPTAGAGKTVLVATLGRALSSLGESVALAETSPGSPLPAHFSVKHLQPGDVRVISPATGSPISLVTYEVDAAATNPARQTVLAESFISLGANAHRLLLDLTERAGWFLGRLIRPNLTVLVPVTPTMSSIISLQSIERFFRELAGPEASPLEPYYLIVQFDESLTVHRDVRDFLSRRVGERLLPVVIRTAPGVAQAFTKGMTVVDYAPNSPIAADYSAVAHWLRALSPPIAPVPPLSRLHLSRWAHP